MKSLGIVQKPFAIAAIAILLQLCSSSGASAGNLAMITMKQGERGPAIQTRVKLEVNRQESRARTKGVPIIQLALAPKIGEIDSIIAHGCTCLARQSGTETLSKKWGRSDEFKLKFSVDRYWADQFVNEFRKNWIDAERKRTPSFADLYGH